MQESLRHYHGDYYSHQVYVLFCSTVCFTPIAGQEALIIDSQHLQQSPGVLQEITSDPITLCMQHALLNLCKCHNYSFFFVLHEHECAALAEFHYCCSTTCRKCILTFALPVNNWKSRVQYRNWAISTITWTTHKRLSWAFSKLGSALGNIHEDIHNSPWGNTGQEMS